MSHEGAMGCTQGRAKVGRRWGAKVDGPLLFGCRLAESESAGWTGLSRIEMRSRASLEQEEWEAPDRGAGVERTTQSAK